MSEWVYRRSDGRWLHGGMREPPYDPATEGRVRLRRPPDVRTERYDPAAGIRPATAAEIAAYDAEHMASELDGAPALARLLKAHVIWTATKLGIPLATARAEILAIAKTLGGAGS